MDLDFMDIAESAATKMDLNVVRAEDKFSVALNNGKFILSVFVKSDDDLMHFSCDINIHVPGKKRAAILQAIAEVNERMWIGHFDYIARDKSIVFSLTIPFMSSFIMDSAVISSIYRLITEECSRFHGYFSFVINEKPSATKLRSFFIETMGKA